MDKFISEHLINEDVDIYCGWTDKFSGKVVGYADGVLTLDKKGRFHAYIGGQDNCNLEEEAAISLPFLF